MVSEGRTHAFGLGLEQWNYSGEMNFIICRLVVNLSIPTPKTVAVASFRQD